MQNFVVEASVFAAMRAQSRKLRRLTSTPVPLLEEVRMEPSSSSVPPRNKTKCGHLVSMWKAVGSGRVVVSSFSFFVTSLYCF